MHKVFLNHFEKMKVLDMNCNICRQHMLEVTWWVRALIVTNSLLFVPVSLMMGIHWAFGVLDFLARTRDWCFENLELDNFVPLSSSAIQHQYFYHVKQYSIFRYQKYQYWLLCQVLLVNWATITHKISDTNSSFHVK